MDASTIASEIDRLGPWITGFAAEGRNFGGQYFAEHDTRIHAFPLALDRLLRGN